ncbi:MAG: spermine/spermidine synthase domain-containing protein [Usitatibacter sp.]
MKRKIEAIFVLFFASGFAGLIYESVWSHYAKLFLGHAAYAQTLVLVVFIGGLAIGAGLCARFSQRLRNPLRLYALVEAVIGILALLFHPLFVAAIDWSLASLLPATCGAESAICVTQWLLTAALLAPQSILLGATFPLVSSAVLRFRGDQPGHDISSLYFLNSLGAALGVLASAFMLIPRFGLPGTLQFAGCVNIALAAGAALLSRAAPSSRDASGDAATPAGEGGERFMRLLLATAFLTGLSSFIYEIVWIRLLSLVLGASTHSFELMLASFILGLALGGMWIRNRIDGLGNPVVFLGRVQIVMGLAAAATVPLYLGSFDFMAWLLTSVSRSSGGYLLFNLSSSFIALLVMLPATFCAGMTLPLITALLLRSRQGERALGTVYAVNTLGSIAGVVLAVHLLMYQLGAHGALLVGAMIDVVLGIVLFVAAGGGATRRSRVLAAAPASLTGLGVIALIAVFFPVDPRLSSSGVFRTGAARLAPSVKVAYYRDGKTASVAVLEEQGIVGIRTNGKPDASLSLSLDAMPIGDEFTMTLLALLPLGHQPAAKTAAVIGFGSGMSTTVLLNSPNLQRVDTVEIEPAMVEGARHFRPVVNAAFDDPRSHIVIDDAKSYFARGSMHYDIIVSEPSNPWVSGVASLFTAEFYRRLHGHLNEGGVLSQWLHTYEMDSETLASIIAAVSQTFPDFAVYSSIDSDIVLIARKAGAAGRFDERVLAWPAMVPGLRKLKLTELELIRRRAVATSALLVPLFASFEVAGNSDYYPVVEQRASKTRFTRARVNELTDLEASAIPMREMLEDFPPPSVRRHDSIPVTYLDVAVGDAWMVRDTILGDRGPERDPIISQLALNARLVRQWSAGCPSELTFDSMLPSLVSTAEASVPYLNPEVAGGLWRFVGQSRCAQALPREQRHWIELFEATSRRDSSAMASLGKTILEGTRGSRNPATEFAFFASVTALVCRGDTADARALFESRADWVRGGTRSTELRLLDMMTRGPGSGIRSCGQAKS